MTTGILIILTGSLGDIARALCLPAHIKTQIPESRLSWLVEEKWVDLIADHPHIDRAVTFQRAWRIKSVTDVMEQLKNESYDITLDLQRILKSALLSIASGAERRIGFHRRNAKEMNWLFNNEHISYLNEKSSKLQHYLKFCEHLGLPDPVTLEFGLTPLSNASYTGESLRSPYIAVVTGSSWPSKDWHGDGYHGLISKILAAGRYSVVLLGDKTQALAAGQLRGRLQSDRVIDLTGRTSLKELVSILGNADAALGPDTGSGHLAAAVGTPYVTMIGPTEAERVAPYGCEHLVVKGNEPCSPCGKKKCRKPRYDCMGAITPEAVFEKLSMALDASKKAVE